jgi:hypothetical protein
VYSYRHHPNDGNYFNVEYVDAADPRQATGLFTLKSARTGQFVHYSATDLTPKGRKQIYQSPASANATVLYLF